ncbi:hypothetical protein R3P38DRAFT_1036796 [Favolaschia claudopus]|uniref:Uncharacterized protein n=1 Tax=Favolaschia claudopus TaxID=2862362 RepID=A0AAW0BKH4_9AGAR
MFGSTERTRSRTRGTLPRRPTLVICPQCRISTSTVSQRRRQCLHRRSGATPAVVKTHVHILSVMSSAEASYLYTQVSSSANKQGGCTRMPRALGRKEAVAAQRQADDTYWKIDERGRGTKASRLQIRERARSYNNFTRRDEAEELHRMFAAASSDLLASPRIHIHMTQREPGSTSSCSLSLSSVDAARSRLLIRHPRRTSP